MSQKSGCPIWSPIYTWQHAEKFNIQNFLSFFRKKLKIFLMCSWKYYFYSFVCVCVCWIINSKCIWVWISCGEKNKKTRKQDYFYFRSKFLWVGDLAIDCVCMFVVSKKDWLQLFHRREWRVFIQKKTSIFKAHKNNSTQIGFLSKRGNVFKLQPSQNVLNSLNKF